MAASKIQALWNHPAGPKTSSSAQNILIVCLQQLQNPKSIFGPQHLSGELVLQTLQTSPSHLKRFLILSKLLLPALGSSGHVTAWLLHLRTGTFSVLMLPWLELAFINLPAKFGVTISLKKSKKFPQKNEGDLFLDSSSWFRLTTAIRRPGVYTDGQGCPDLVIFDVARKEWEVVKRPNIMRRGFFTDSLSL
ncbi:hypothetical protein Cni_G18307 [Canna indica]|uniref:Uncharacterized protein n=1 Tax=Canna indica TaxID=4628 RepID=A0AAQ3QFY5_9LILI|nr:hypothetical protein Cni_G18307 [Canna indica]